MVSIHFINKVFQNSTVIWATFESVATFYKGSTLSQREKSNYSLKNSLPIINNEL